MAQYPSLHATHSLNAIAKYLSEGFRRVEARLGQIEGQNREVLKMLLALRSTVSAIHQQVNHEHERFHLPQRESRLSDMTWGLE